MTNYFRYYTIWPGLGTPRLFNYQVNRSRRFFIQGLKVDLVDLMVEYYTKHVFFNQLASQLTLHMRN